MHWKYLLSCIATLKKHLGMSAQQNRGVVLLDTVQYNSTAVHSALLRRECDALEVFVVMHSNAKDAFPASA